MTLYLWRSVKISTILNLVSRSDDMTKAKAQHVVPRSGKWGVLTSGASRASSVHTTQAEAIETAREIAKSRKTELYIHGQDGRIRERNSYGSDSFPPKG